jgi:CBS domain containing-hemolysin-like protein
MNSPIFYLVILLSCLLFEAFFVMQEMACVSFNKVRLQYFLSIGSKRAKWLNFLLSHPTKLYGTTLISSNAALLLGSEAARRFYEANGLSPDLAPITQIVLVLVFAEMAPMFAARRHPEQVAMLGVPVLFIFSKLLFPIIKFLDLLCRLINKCFGVEVKKSIFLSRDEIQKILDYRQRPVRKFGQFKAPSLIGVFDNAVFFHDASVDNLKDAISRINSLLHLNLSDSDVGDLEQYLKTL